MILTPALAAVLVFVGGLVAVLTALWVEKK